MIPKLPFSLKTKLYQITPSHDGRLPYYPCRATLKDGRTVDHVYFAPVIPYLEHWGVLPGDFPGRLEIQAGEVADLEESVHRLPVPFANALYNAGESGMGYYSFELEFVDGSRQRYVTGNAIDFLPLPDGKTWTQVINVLPHVRGDEPYLEGLEYTWCIFDPSPAAA